MSRKHKTVEAAVVPFRHVLVAVLNYDVECPRGASCEVPPDHLVCSTLALAKQALANHSCSGTVEAWEVDGDNVMKLWRKVTSSRRCPVKHLEQVDTSYYWPGRTFDPADAITYEVEP
jgi:hypothetical protein